VQGIDGERFLVSVDHGTILCFWVGDFIYSRNYPMKSSDTSRVSMKFGFRLSNLYYNSVIGIFYWSCAWIMFLYDFIMRSSDEVSVNERVQQYLKVYVPGHTTSFIQSIFNYWYSFYHVVYVLVYICYVMSSMVFFVVLRWFCAHKFLNHN
jgi:hypothetical protein